MNRLKTALATGVTVLAAALVAPAAHADDSDFMYGDCGFGSAEVFYTNGTHTGWIEDRSVTTTGYANPQLIGATVTCWIEVNGVVAPGTTHSYGDLPGLPGVQVGADPASFVTTDVLDNVQVCETVAYADGTTRSHCIYNDLSLPTIRQREYIDHVATTAFAIVDPTVCAELASHAGSYPGDVTIGPDGDVYAYDVPDPLGLGLTVLYDCPPYLYR